MGEDDDIDFPLPPPENTAESDALSNYIDDESSEPSTSEVNERMGTSFSDEDDAKDDGGKD